MEGSYKGNCSLQHLEYVLIVRILADDTIVRGENSAVAET